MAEAGGDSGVLEVVVMVVRDRRGRVVMQHRTEDAPTSPGLWAVPGGGVDPGESAVSAAHRELLEETGLRCDLTFNRVYERPSSSGKHQLRIHVFTGTTDARDEDVVCGEGQAMVFLTPEEAWQKDLTRVAREVLPQPTPTTSATAAAGGGSATAATPGGSATPATPGGSATPATPGGSAVAVTPGG